MIRTDIEIPKNIKYLGEIRILNYLMEHLTDLNFRMEY